MGFFKKVLIIAMIKSHPQHFTKGMYQIRGGGVVRDRPPFPTPVHGYNITHIMCVGLGLYLIGDYIG